MKCPNCSYHNLSKSDFCQECGYEFNKNKRTRLDDAFSKSSHNESILDDVIFKPRRKTGFIGRIVKLGLILAGIGFLGLIGLVIIGLALPEETPENGTQEVSTSFPITSLSIEDYDIEYVGDEAYFTGTLKNSNSRSARNVAVRLDFYNDKAQTKHFDTRRVTIEYGADAKGAFSFQVPLYVYPQGQFWWVWQIEGAEYGM